MQFLKAILLFIIQKVLLCRYRLDVKGLDAIERSSFHNESGILFLPNHPAEIDPVLIFMLLEQKFTPHPLVVEHFYYMKGARFFMKLVGALPIPVVESMGNKWKLKKIQQALATVKRGLVKGKNFLIYPSGHLKREGYEKIGGNSFIHTIMSELPNTRIVLVRTTGLWGSQFSRARDGRLPDFWRMALRGIGVLLRYGFIFCPKRDVLVEFEPAPADFPYGGTRLELNQYLEKWYNQYLTEGGDRVKEEPLKLTPYGSKKRRLPIERKKREKKKALALTEEEKKKIRGKIAEMAECPEESVHEDLELAADLGLDSLDLADIYTYIDQRYDIEEVKIEEILTVYDVYEAASGHQKKSQHNEEKKQRGGWQEQARGDVHLPEGSTLVEALFYVARRMGTASACADMNAGSISYRKLLLTALVLSLKIRKFPGKYIGILLPSSIATYAFILATLMARKVPVMLNWTTGVRNLNYAKELLNLKTVISSRKFLNKVDQLDLGELESAVVLGEEIKSSISFWTKLKGLALSKLSMGLRLKKMGLNHMAPNDPAVVLFTSGTESFPKAVPLSHRNILENQRAALSCVEFFPSDILYGVLPAFHSFGFSVTGLLPLLSGLRVFFAPDPTDAHAMADDVSNWGITIFCCAPTFYRNLFRIASKQQLMSVRLFVTGAEKAGDDLFRYVADLGAEMIEGYGITECSPMITIVRPGGSDAGVGKPLPGIELICVDPETKSPVKKGAFGEVAIKGPNVFSGYLGSTAASPFIEIQGEKWYASGDLGHIDAEGNLILGGRLKRFVKIGGEMVSLSAIEEEILKLAKRKGWEPLPVDAPALCIMGHESDRGKPKLILFAVFDALKEDINEALSTAGFGRIIKISEVRKLKEIPLTGTSKVHLNKLKEYLA